MTTFEEKVKAIFDEIYKNNVQQILIDLVQDTEELIHELVSRENIGAACYDCSILLEVYNPKFEKDIDILTRLYKALDEWRNDIENTNILLGIPREK